MAETACPECGVEYRIVCEELEENGIVPRWCPFCRHQVVDELDFREPEFAVGDGEWD